MDDHCRRQLHRHDGDRARPRAAAEASLVVALDFLRLPVSALIGFAAFGQVPAVWVWLGGGIIVISTILLTRRESRAGPPRGRR